MRHAKVLLVSTLILASGLAFTQSRPSLPDQVIINTQRISDIERRIDYIERRLSSVADHTSRDDIISAQQSKELQEIRNVLFGVGVFTVSNLVGLLLFLLKDRLFGKANS